MSEVHALEELFESAPRAVFIRRNVAIPGDLRITWRLSTLCLILQRFRGKKSTLENLHIMSWAIRSAETRDLFLRWFEGDKKPNEVIVRFDPSLSVSVDLAVGSGLVSRTATGSISLLPTGLALAEELWSDSTVLVEEKAFVAKLPKSLTQRTLKELTEWN